MRRTRFASSLALIRRERGEEGFALVSAIMILMVILGLGLAMMRFADDQQRASSREQWHESSYNLAEGALNAEVSKLAVSWIGAGAWAPSAPPSGCTTGSSMATGCICNQTTTFGACPDPNGSWVGAYTPLGSAWCPPGTQTDAWSTTPTTTWSTVPNSWATYVRDDGGGTTQLFSSSTDATQPPYDANGDGSVWVRSVGEFDCRTTVLISKASEQFIPLSFPKYALNANGFSVNNNGNKVVIDTSGIYAQPSDPNPQAGPISVRCAGLGGNQNCTKYRAGSQIDTDTCVASSTSPYGCTKFPSTSNQTLTDLSGLKAEAMAYGTYYGGPGTATGCPTTAAQLNSVVTPGGIAPVYVDTNVSSGVQQSCNISLGGSAQINSPSQPGVLVMAGGTLSLGGSVTFFGLVYNADLCWSGSALSPCTTAANVVTVSSSAEIQGSINVDGAGMISLGSSGNGSNGRANFVYDSRIFPQLQTLGGAAAVPNSFRELPITQ